MRLKGVNITASEIFRLFLLKFNDIDSSDEDNVQWFKQAIDANMIDHNRVWFKMFKGDTAATSANDIVHDVIKLPRRHNNHKYMVELLESGINNPSEIEVYLD